MNEQKNAHSSAAIDGGQIIGTQMKTRYSSFNWQNGTTRKSLSPGQNFVESPDVVSGKNTRVQNNISIDTVTCEKDAFSGPQMEIGTALNSRSVIASQSAYRKTQQFNWQLPGPCR